MKDYDFLVFIGRFQPFHLGHLRVLREALVRSEHVIVCCGSAYGPRSIRNPWTFVERRDMIRTALDPADRERVLVAPLMDHVYNDSAWVSTVQGAVAGLVASHHRHPHRAPRIGLIGHQRDHSSYYLKLFPQWTSVGVPDLTGVNATQIRRTLFEAGQADAQRLPDTTTEVLQAFLATENYTELVAEQRFIEKYRSAWAGAPYPPTFVTVDAVVTQSGHVLLVQRRAWPGKGLWALPGGFVGEDEGLRAACLREVKEETRIKLPLPVLEGHIRQSRVFDHPYRSLRGRTFTHAFHIDLPPDQSLPKVRGGDDARNAFWLPLAQLDPARFFEDHYYIIQELVYS